MWHTRVTKWFWFLVIAAAVVLCIIWYKTEIISFLGTLGVK